MSDVGGVIFFIRSTIEMLFFVLYAAFVEGLKVPQRTFNAHI